MNRDEPNNVEQQQTFNAIMQSVLSFDSHEFHFISGPGGTGKSALFRKLQAACRAEGILISICAAITLAALLFEGATTAHSLFGYPVEELEDIDDQIPAQCNFSEERSALLHEVLVIFWDEIVSNDRSLFEAVLHAMKTKWEKPQYYVFICAGDFAQVRFLLFTNDWQSFYMSSLMEMPFPFFRYFQLSKGMKSQLFSVR